MTINTLQGFYAVKFAGRIQFYFTTIDLALDSCNATSNVAEGQWVLTSEGRRWKCGNDLYEIQMIIPTDKVTRM